MEFSVLSIFIVSFVISYFFTAEWSKCVNVCGTFSSSVLQLVTSKQTQFFRYCEGGISGHGFTSTSALGIESVGYIIWSGISRSYCISVFVF